MPISLRAILSAGERAGGIPGSLVHLNGGPDIEVWLRPSFIVYLLIGTEWGANVIRLLERADDDHSTDFPGTTWACVFGQHAHAFSMI